MQRYVVVDADGYAGNVILWDGVTPFSASGTLVTESKCKAKQRGYSERKEITGPAGKPIEVNVPEDELDKIIAGE